ncbi:MAG TPA: type I-F CRISPR-associated protein Csy2 [Xanthomonadales bacterium]|nr:type I-F CRISPR-associated protein Csy2 [Xanthomonadales bacterium]
MNRLPPSVGLLTLPHLRVQNANAASSPLTHGFPSMTAFIGLMWVLERRLAERRHTLGAAIGFDSVAVVCHDHQEQTVGDRYARAFRLTRNPVDKDGDTAAIVEEGRIHLDITLIFGVSGDFIDLDESQRQTLADAVADTVATLRVAGGSVLAPRAPRWRTRPQLEIQPQDAEAAARMFRRVRGRWLPGFTLVCRDDLLKQRHDELRRSDPDATGLDALLDLSRINWRADLTRSASPEPANPNRAENNAPMPESSAGKIEWRHDRTQGWIVPIPVGYGALTEVQPAGSVRNARDPRTPFRFVESLYSIGQWIGPHHLTDVSQMLWYPDSDPEQGLYRCRNEFVRTYTPFL